MDPPHALAGEGAAGADRSGAERRAARITPHPTRLSVPATHHIPSLTPHPTHRPLAPPACTIPLMLPSHAVALYHPYLPAPLALFAHPLTIHIYLPTLPTPHTPHM